MISGLLAGFFWALDTCVLAAALAFYPDTPSMALAATLIHDTCSALLLIVLVFISGQPKPLIQALKKPSGLWLIAGGILGGPIGMAGYVLGVSYLGADLAAACSALYPALGAGLAWIFCHEKMNPVQILGLGLSMGCAFALAAGPVQGGQNVPPGLVGMVLCTSGWALEGLFVQQARLPALSALCIRQSISTLFFLFIWLPVFQLSGDIQHLLQPEILKMIGLAALCGTISYLLYYQAIGQISAAKAMPLNSTYVAWAILINFMMGSAISFFHLLLAFGVVAGAAICVTGCKKTGSS